MDPPTYGAVFDVNVHSGIANGNEKLVVPEPLESQPASSRRRWGFVAGTLALFGTIGAVFHFSTKQPEVPEQTLWERLSDADELLAYAASYAVEDPNTLDDDNFWPLSCDDYDDDSVYPNDLCISGDNSTCHDSSVMTANYVLACEEACKEGWGVPCGWEAVSELPALCSGRFNATAPSVSNNLAPSPYDAPNTNTLTINSTGETYWACNVHAFCYACVDADSIVNDFCKAAVIRTKSLYGASAVFKYMDSYWCEEDIIEDIENGTFCGYTAEKMYSCEDKNSHASPISPNP